MTNEISERVRVAPHGMTPGTKRRKWTLKLESGEWPTDKELLELVGGAPFGGGVSEAKADSAFREVFVWVD